MRRRILAGALAAALFLPVAADAAGRWNVDRIGPGQCSTFAFDGDDAADAQPPLTVPAGPLWLTAEIGASAVAVSLYAVPAPGSDTPASAGQLLATFSGDSRTPLSVSVNGSYVVDPDIDADGDGGSITVCAAGLARATLPDPAAASPFGVCKAGALGGGYDPATGLFAWTCAGRYDWAGTGGVYKVECSGDGTASGYTGPGAGSCLRAGESRLIGALHSIGSAIDRTKDGGTAYLPEGIYVDTGCGTLADGVTRAQCPRPYLADRRARADFAVTGAHALRAAIVVDRGIVLRGEGSPTEVTEDPGDATVTKHRPKLSGTWILNDRGNFTIAGGFGTGCAASDCRTPDGPSQNLHHAEYGLSIGGPDWSTDLHGFCDLNAQGGCDEEQNSTEFFAPASFYPYGAQASLLATTNQAAGTMCVEDTPSGTSDATYDGVCSDNPLVRCGAAGADIARASHGCGNTGTDGFDYGTCQGLVTQMEADITAGYRRSLQFIVAQCADNPAAAADCDVAGGSMSFLASVHTFGAACSTTGRTITVGSQGGGSNSTAWPFPFGDWVTGGTGVNLVRAIDPEKFAAGGTVLNIGRMPANWVGRNSAEATADCLSGGDNDNADDEQACDTGHLLGFPTGANGRFEHGLVFNASMAHNFASAIDHRGRNHASAFRHNRIIGRRRGTLSDTCATDWSYNSVEGDAGQESVGTLGASGISNFCGDTRIAFNVFRAFGGNSGLIRLSRNARNIVIADNLIDQARAAPAISILAGRNITVARNRINSQGAVGIDLDIGGQSGTGSTELVADVAILRNDFNGRLSSGSGSYPKTAINIRASTASTTMVDEIEGFVVDGNHVVNDEDDMCLVWLDDDAAADDATALVEEEFGRITVTNNTVRSDGSPRVLCMGDQRTAGTNLDATDSRDPLKENFAPRAWGNVANGVMESPILLSGQPAATTPDCNTGGNCYNGFTVRITDGAGGANTCVDATADGILDGGGTTPETCVWHAVTGTWVPL